MSSEACPNGFTIAQRAGKEESPLLMSYRRGSVPEGSGSQNCCTTMRWVLPGTAGTSGIAHIHGPAATAMMPAGSVVPGAVRSDRSDSSAAVQSRWTGTPDTSPQLAANLRAGRVAQHEAPMRTCIQLQLSQEPPRYMGRFEDRLTSLRRTAVSPLHSEATQAILVWRPSTLFRKMQHDQE
jgi:hypothetical protein